MLLERVADDLGLEEMVKAVRVKAMVETGREQLKEKKHNEISDKLDTIILGLGNTCGGEQSAGVATSRGSNQQG